MASALRVLPTPTQYYVAVSVSGEDVSAYELSNNGVTWDPVSYIPVNNTAGRTIFKDLGTTVFFNPRTGEPPVDLRKVAVISDEGIEVNQIKYIPLGTRLKGNATQQRAAYKSCWVALMGASVAEQQFGLRS
jgi:hypothetical protein